MPLPHILAKTESRRCAGGTNGTTTGGLGSQGLTKTKRIIFTRKVANNVQETAMT